MTISESVKSVSNAITILVLAVTVVVTLSSPEYAAVYVATVVQSAEIVIFLLVIHALVQVNDILYVPCSKT